MNSERIAELDSIEDDEVYHSRLRDILEDDIFFTNAVLCYPGEDKEPTASELRTCRKRLHRTIYLLDPRLVIAAGRTAATALVGKKVRVLERRGSLMDIAVESPVTGRSVRYPMLVLLDPGQIWKSGERELVHKKTGKAWQTIEDMKRALQFLKTYDTIAQRRES
jgi:uracil-DNA glycosylase family 4